VVFSQRIKDIPGASEQFFLIIRYCFACINLCVHTVSICYDCMFSAQIPGFVATVFLTPQKRKSTLESRQMVIFECFYLLSCLIYLEVIESKDSF